MTSQSIRMMKEFRILAWPCAAVTSAAVLALMLQALRLEWGPINADALTALGFFVGVPLLAGLGLGAEFQYRTLGLSLAQPLERREIWRSKVLVTLAAVVPVGLLFCIRGYWQLEGIFRTRSLWPVMMFLIITTAAAFPMTLIARSTIGGLALQGIGSMPVFWGAVWIVDYLRMHGRLSPLLITALALAVVIYAAGMVWWGRRMFLRFQAVEGMQAVEAVLPGAALLPAAVADWFRCRPSGVVLNLVRREFRLLRAVWPLAALSTAAWICLVAFHVVPLGNNEHGYKAVLLAFTGIVSMLIALLSGALSLGEEKTSGTHDWQLTLPVSPSLQWFVKVSVAISTSVFCAALLPMSILFVAGRYHGNVGSYLESDLVWLWPLQIAGITFAAFWSACLMKGTVRAALLTFPACLIVFSAGPIGQWLPSLVPAQTKHFVDWLISVLGPVESGRAVARIAASLGFWDEKIFAIPAGLLFAIALIQSHRLFREPSDDSKLRVMRYLSPMFIALLICSLTVAFFIEFVRQAFPAQERLAREIDSAIEKVILTRPEVSTPLHINAEELAKTSSLSPEARHWLADSTMVIVPRPSFLMAPAPWEFNFGFFDFSRDREPAQPYSAVVRFAGSSCSISHREGKPRGAIFAAVCD